MSGGWAPHSPRSPFSGQIPWLLGCGCAGTHCCREVGTRAECIVSARSTASSGLLCTQTPRSTPDPSPQDFFPHHDRVRGLDSKSAPCALSPMMVRRTHHDHRHLSCHSRASSHSTTTAPPTYLYTTANNHAEDFAGLDLFEDDGREGNRCA